MIELVTPRIFHLKQDLINYAINEILVPRLNKILTMYSVNLPSTKLGVGNKKDDVIYFRPLDDATIIKYQKEHPVKYPNDNLISNIFGMKKI